MNVVVKSTPPSTGKTASKPVLWQTMGPQMWAELHAFSLQGDLQNAGNWMDRFSRRIPCGECRRHWIELQQSSPPTYASHDEFFTWSVAAHNAVNHRLGKPEMSLEEAKQRWTERRATTPLVAAEPRRLVLRSRLSPGDILMLTAAVRDLHRAHPGKYLTAIDTPTPELWEHNPFVSAASTTAEWETIDMHYPLINQSNQRPVHFIEGYAKFLEAKLGVPIPVTDFKGDIHLAAEEKQWTNQVEEEFGFKGKFWIIIAGGKFDFTAKWWPPQSYQTVVDHFAGRISFVQCGQNGHWHPKLNGVFDLVGKTSIRQLVRLMYHAEGVICPVTFAMHLAAAVPTRTARLRPCVVIAGGREPPHWEAYPGHQFLHTVGALPCCATGGCWKSRCQQVGDGDAKDRHNLCERPIPVGHDLRVPQCMTLIQPRDVIRAAEQSCHFS